MCAHHPPRVVVHEVARGQREVGLQEPAEVPAADEADAHGLLLGQHAQRRQVLRCQEAHLRLEQRAEREEHMSEAGARSHAQEVRLVFVLVPRSQQLGTLGRRLLAVRWLCCCARQTRVVPKCDVLGAQALLYPLEELVELDVAVAEDIGVRGAQAWEGKGRDGERESYPSKREDLCRWLVLFVLCALLSPLL